MKIVARGGGEDLLRQAGRCLDGGGAHRPHQNVELGWEGRKETPIGADFLMQEHGGLATTTQPICKLTVCDEREQLLGCPQGYGGSAGARTLQADLAQMQIMRSEIGVGRIMFIKAAYSRITKKDAAAAIRLQPMLVRINHDGVGLGHAVKGARCLLAKGGDELEISAVGGIEVNAEWISARAARALYGADRPLR